MKVGDLIRLPYGEGCAIICKIFDDRDWGCTVVVVRDEGVEYWDADTCMVINESR